MNIMQLLGKIVLKFAYTCMDMEPTMLNKISQRRRRDIELLQLLVRYYKEGGVVIKTIDMKARRTGSW